MKIATPDEMRQLEAVAYQHGCKEEDFMETAGSNIAKAIAHYIQEQKLPKTLTLLIGKGNNGGDTYVAGRYLLKSGFTVHAIQPIPMPECSPLLQLNAKRYQDGGGTIQATPTLLQGVLIDGIFGTGFQGKPREPFASFIQIANSSKLPILAIDIPSGLNGTTGAAEGCSIKATKTLFLQLPKQGFFINEGINCTGKLVSIDFGLPPVFIESFRNRSDYLQSEEVSRLLPKLPRSRHKYQAGYAVGWAGSPGMAGAAILCGNTTLKSGAGITRLYHPEGMEYELSQALPELILRRFNPKIFPEEMVQEWKRATALFIGPGIGLNDNSKRLLKELLPQVELPILLDADALTLIASMQLNPPKGAILTPHLGELKRLLQATELPQSNLDLWETCIHYVNTYQVTLVVKGVPTYIFHPDQPIAVMVGGDPGMATAGSGDVLSGLLAGLLAQGLPPYEAAKLGTYLHALAGEIAAKHETSYCMTASSIIKYLPESYKRLLKGS